MGADVEAAKALIAAYTGQPSAFPIDTPLAKKATGKRIAFIDCGTPICGIFGSVLEPAATALGMKVTVIKGGFEPDKVQAAFDTVIQDKYDGVIVPALPPQLWQRQLDQLVEAGIPVATTGVIGADPAKVPVQQAGQILDEKSGALLAAQVVADQGDKANVVIYDTPELSFIRVIVDSFKTKLAELCPTCTVREVQIPVAQFGTTATQTVVSDLQANPESNYLVFPTGEAAHGLPAALDTAGLKVATLVGSADPVNLQDVKDGKIDRVLAVDLPVIMFTLADTMARQTTGEPPAPGALADATPIQFLTQSDVTYDVSKGWVGYPDFFDRFMALWSQAK